MISDGKVEGPKPKKNESILDGKERDLCITGWMSEMWVPTWCTFKKEKEKEEEEKEKRRRRSWENYFKKK